MAANLLAAAFCVGLIGYALYSQYRLRYDPCPLCLFQRFAVIALGGAFVVAALVSTLGRGLRMAASALIAVIAMGGAAVSARHLYIQWLPDDQVPACGASLDFMWQVFSVSEVLKKVFTGSGECHRIDWTFLGLAMPAWVLICVLGLAAYGALVNWPSRAR